MDSGANVRFAAHLKESASGIIRPECARLRSLESLWLGGSDWPIRAGLGQKGISVTLEALGVLRRRKSATLEKLMSIMKTAAAVCFAVVALAAAPAFPGDASSAADDRGS
jgi:hypothetical protein